ncbi:hypothetical protein A5719_01860 [Mycolicibacterium peregrinum]|nr:hypothetical protein A5719_01860 [Mycolicibacterium peregrinum]
MRPHVSLPLAGADPAHPFSDRSDGRVERCESSENCEDESAQHFARVLDFFLAEHDVLHAREVAKSVLLELIVEVLRDDEGRTEPTAEVCHAHHVELFARILRVLLLQPILDVGDGLRVGAVRGV